VILKLFSNVLLFGGVNCNEIVGRLDHNFLPINNCAVDSDIPVIVVLRNLSNAKSTSALLTCFFLKSVSLSEHNAQPSHLTEGSVGWKL